MSYEDALNHVNTRRPVLPHVQLRDTIYGIYPRPWAPHLAARTSSSTVYSEDIPPEPEPEPEPETPEPVSDVAMNFIAFIFFLAGGGRLEPVRPNFFSILSIRM